MSTRRARIEARRIERYWSGLRADRATPPPAGLAPDLATFIARLDAEVRLPAPPAAFVDELRGRLLGGGAAGARAWSGPAMQANYRRPETTAADVAAEPTTVPGAAGPPIPLTRRRWAREAAQIAAAIIVFAIIGGALILTLRDDTRRRQLVQPVPTATPLATPSAAPTSAPQPTATSTAGPAPTATNAPPTATPTLPPIGTLKTITAGSQPRQLAIGADAVWVTNSGDGTVSRIDPATNAVVATIDLKNGAPAAGYQADGITLGADSLWVSSYEGQQPEVVRIDPATNAIITRIPIDEAAWYLIYAAGSVWAKGYGPDVAMRIDPQTNAQVAVVPIPNVSTLFGSDDVVFATVQGTSDLTMIDPATNATSQLTLDLAGVFFGAALRLDGATVWLSTATAITGIDLATGQTVATVPLPDVARGQGASLMGITADAFWVDRGPPDTLWRIDRATGRALAAAQLPNWKDIWYANGSFWMPTFDGVVVRLDVAP